MPGCCAATFVRSPMSSSMFARNHSLSAGASFWLSALSLGLCNSFHGPWRTAHCLPSRQTRTSCGLGALAERITGTMLGQSREPIASMHHLGAHFAFGQMTRPRNDGGQPDAALEQTEFRAAIRPAASAAVVRAFFDGMAVVGLIDDDGVVAQAGVFKEFHQPLHAFIKGRDERRVKISWKRSVLVMLKPF